MIEIVNTINLYKRTDRLLSIAQQAREQNFALRIWPGVEGDTSMKNINAAYRKIIKEASTNGDAYAIIMEDDCLFSSPNSFRYYMDNRPENFDIWLGMVYAAEVKNGRIMNGYSGNTLITITRDFYYYWLSMPDDVHPDRWVGQFAYERKYYVCEPYVCRQLNGYSDNKRQDMNYNVYTDTMTFLQ